VPERVVQRASSRAERREKPGVGERIGLEMQSDLDHSGALPDPGFVVDRAVARPELHQREARSRVE